MPTQDEKVTQVAFAQQFLNNVNSIILAGAYHNGSIPHFSGTTVYNPSYNNANTYTAYSNPQAVPTSDLDSAGSAAAGADISGIGVKEDIVRGATVYNVLYEAIRRLTRVRNFTSNWYHKTNTSFALVNSVSGKAVFKESLPGIAGFPGADNTPNAGWSRTINDTLQPISVANSGVVHDNVMRANEVNNFFTNLNNAWAETAANAVGYTFYSCHNNCHCHGNCDSRSRR